MDRPEKIANATANILNIIEDVMQIGIETNEWDEMYEIIQKELDHLIEEEVEESKRKENEEDMAMQMKAEITKQRMLDILDMPEQVTHVKRVD